MAVIILIGYRGVGKSTIASEIVKTLSKEHEITKVSLDEKRFW